ncbi:MAG: amidohydrolase family protein, partial [Rubrobacteraceae bacterium]
MFRSSGIGIMVFAVFLFAVIGCSGEVSPEDVSTGSDEATHAIERTEPEAERTEETAREAVGVDLVLSGGTLIDGTGAPPVEDALVAVDDGEIAAVGRAGEVEEYRGDETFDVSGETILPGFVNAHAHSRDISLEETKEWTRDGVTTVRDLAGSEEEMAARKEETSGDPEFPRLLVSGPMITVPGGHPFPIYGPDYPALAVNGPENAASEVNRLLDTGVDHIKIVVSGSADTGWPELSDAEIRAITDAAHAREARVV